MRIDLNKEYSEKNKVLLTGTIAEELRYCNIMNNKIYFKTTLISQRLSGVKDIIKIIVSEEILGEYLYQTLKGKTISIEGELHSYWKLISVENPHQDYVVNVKSFNIYENVEDLPEQVNLVYLDGFVCRQPFFKVKSTGMEVAETVVAVNSEERSNYIPCVSWRNVAYNFSKLPEGQQLKIFGRLQSRMYKKDFQNPFEKETVTNEVAIINFKKI